MIDKTHWDVAMHFEDLARSVFNCDRAGDPWGYANADSAPHLLNFDGKAKFFTIIDVAIWENRDNNDLVNGLLEVRSSIMVAAENDNSTDFLHQLIDLLNEHGY